MARKDSLVRCELDINLTIALIGEGYLADIRHYIQGMRKRAGLGISDKIIVCTEIAKYFNLYSIKEDLLCIAVLEELHDGCCLVEEYCGTKIGIALYEKGEK